MTAIELTFCAAIVACALWILADFIK